MNQYNPLKGKVALVTGSAQGIGKNIARVLGQHGATVVVCDIHRPLVKDTCKQFVSNGIKAHGIVANLSIKNASRKLMSAIVKKHGRIDILVNNAKSGKRLSLTDETEINWDNTMGVTLKTVFFLSQAAIPTMAKHGGGSIINIASVAGSVIGHDAPSYHAAKSAVIHITKYLAVHAGKFGIRVNAVSPGFIVKDEHQERFTRDDNAPYREIANFSQPIGRVGSSDEIAHAVAFLASTEASFITGHCLTIDGGLTVQDQSGMLYRFSKEHLAYSHEKSTR